VIPIAGGIAIGLVWGWLLAQRFPDLAAAVGAAAVAAALAGEAALLAGSDPALGLLAAVAVGASLRAAFGRSLAHRRTPA
jgi:NhaP-type Na+/H+ or K+/H+ antiporter